MNNYEKTYILNDDLLHIVHELRFRRYRVRFSLCIPDASRRTRRLSQIRLFHSRYPMTKSRKTLGIYLLILYDFYFFKKSEDSE